VRTDGRTDGNASKTVYLPVSLRSLGGYKSVIQQQTWSVGLLFVITDEQSVLQEAGSVRVYQYIVSRVHTSSNGIPENQQQLQQQGQHSTQQSHDNNRQRRHE